MRHIEGKKWLAILSLVVLLTATPLLAACGGDDDDDDTPKVTATKPAEPTASPSPTTTAKPTETVTPTKTATPEPLGALLTIDSKLKELMDNPGTKAILEKYLPAQIINSPNLMALGANLTIPQIAPASGGLITDEMLKNISADLTKLGARSATTPAPVGALLTIDSKLKELMDNPGTKAILEKYLPAQIMNSPNLMALGASLTIPQIAPASGGLITDEMLKNISADLTKLGARSATAPTKAPEATVKLTGKPVKIGLLVAWSGPAGMSGLITDEVAKVAEYVAEQQGGVLGGRPVKFERYDSEGNVARVQAGVQKLADDSDVAAIVVGGTTPGEFRATMVASTEAKIPYFTSDVTAELTKFPYTVSATIATPTRFALATDYVLKRFGPKTAAYLADNTDDGKDGVKNAKNALEAAGVKTVSEQYLNIGTSDASPYLTKIRAERPDVLFLYHGGAATYQSIYKQVAEQGGWGDIKVMAPTNYPGLPGIINLPGAEGTYFWATWLPGLLSTPASQAFEQAWQKVHGAAPQPVHAQMYNVLWSAVEAVKQAGTTDRAKIASLIRSGKFAWESPAGSMTFGTDGLNNLKGLLLLIKGGKAVPAP